MKGILYYEPEDAKRNEWFIGELIQAGKTLGIELTLQTSELVPEDDTDFVFYRGRDFKMSKRLENDGMLVVNRSEVSRIANDKLQTAQLASVLGIPVIPTKALHAAADVRTYPVIVKTSDGHGGADVHLCHDETELNEQFTSYPNRALIVQPFIEHGAADVRVYVLGKDVLGAVKRTGSESFKSNVALGGQAEAYDPPVPLRKFAWTLAKALKSDYIGVDFIQNNEGVWLLNEIEDPVGARSLYKTTDLNVAAKIMEHILEKLKKS